VNILAIQVLVVCGYCKGKKRFPGGLYKNQGEVINCPCCNGTGMEKKAITLEEFHKHLKQCKKKKKNP
jgi:hypothetical protein